MQRSQCVFLKIIMFFTRGDAIFRRRPRHPRLAVLEYGFAKDFSPAAKSGIVNYPG